MSAHYGWKNLKLPVMVEARLLANNDKLTIFFDFIYTMIWLNT